MRCEKCGRGTSNTYMVPVSRKHTQYICDHCLDEMYHFADDEEDEVICDCCGEPAEMFVRAKDGTTWCLECVHDTEECESWEIIYA